MAYGKRITEFLRDRAGNLGISSLVLIVLEKMMDNDFVCPCQPGYNEGICACYAIVPFFACFFFTLCFVELKPEDKVTNCSSTRNKLRYPTVIACIWLFLFLVDGGYVSCACSRWGGEYTETGSLKWCKPTGNETVVFESLQETQRCITRSQFAGFGVVLVITFILGISCFCIHRCHDGVQQNGDVPLSYQNNGQRGGEAVEAQ